MPDLPADDAPYYFMSYARTPPAPRRNGVDPNERIVKFHYDLSGLIMELTALPYGASPGFLDEEPNPGPEHRADVFEQLNQCRVFVPMLNARYFRDEWKRKEWYAFSCRPIDGGPERTRQSPIHALKWGEYGANNVPVIFRPQAVRPKTFGQHPDLLTLVVEPELEGEYWRAVNDTAHSIVRLAEAVTVGRSPFGSVADLDQDFARFERGTGKGKRQ